jgi:hypothetical protein
MTDIERKIKKLQNRKIIYVVVACLLIALNLMVDLMNIAAGELNRVPGDGASRIGYFLGSHFFIIFGLLLLYRVFKINRQIAGFKNCQLQKTIDAIGEEEIDH